MMHSGTCWVCRAKRQRRRMENVYGAGAFVALGLMVSSWAGGAHDGIAFNGHELLAAVFAVLLVWGVLGATRREPKGLRDWTEHGHMWVDRVEVRAVYLHRDLMPSGVQRDPKGPARFLLVRPYLLTDRPETEKRQGA